jgi:hypothetical protein
MPNPKNAEQLKELFQKRKDLIQKKNKFSMIEI